MAKSTNNLTIPDEVIMNKIYLIRGKKVMLDRDLAELYGIETKVLKQTVRRNIKRFPSDFLYEMTIEELQDWRSQIVTSKADKKGLRYSPFCFTEHGVIMLASVINSDRAININVQIVRIFTKMREMLASHKETLHKLVKIEHKLAEHDNQILVIFQYLKQLEQVKQQELDQQNRKRLGYKRKDEQ
jgi:phage regulator Rha-like protein